MREIKFRAMMDRPHFGHEGLWVYLQGVGSDLWFSKNGKYYGDIKQGTECQFTGFQDKNEVDIYDGHILGGENKHIVEWHDDGWVIRSISLDWTTRLKTALFQYDIEIIGNIYEDSGMLNQVEEKGIKND